jgi:hypothetical protein
VFLALDHVSGGGHVERRKTPPGITFYNRIIREGFPPKYRLLCHNCNFAIALTGSCPHQVAKDADTSTAWTGTTTQTAGNPTTASDPA